MNEINAEQWEKVANSIAIRLGVNPEKAGDRCLLECLERITELENAPLKSLAEMECAFKEEADRAYCRALELFKRTECLGEDWKLEHGKFGKSELDAHKLASEFMGFHKLAYKFLSLHNCSNSDRIVSTDVFSRPECIFNYCPHPDLCKDKCTSPTDIP